ncbi:glycosyltransferase [Pengzhenrongella sicca]|uniref:Glycosyltransferase n=1 Tax=Pengzhenrongella sicca TaxID=2819238 RepID=A0A8A4ZAW7_9MICO|nr:glycosyltransferase [Pengzhenrongella sicca]QTE29024.1 glycosyltransferase [Pengzhenrongella sicca]
MRISLLGFTLPPDEIAEILRTDANMPAQTSAFAWAVVESLRSAGATVTLLSAAPVTNYPANSRLLFRGHPFHADGVDGETLGFINVLALKHVSRFVACLTTGWRALRRWRPDVLLVHGVHSPFLWFGMLARRLARVRTVVILTDPPGVALATDGPLVRALKRADVAVVRRALRAVDGVIALTGPLATDFAPGRPSLLMEGISTHAAVDRPPRGERPTFRVVYAGGLVQEYGVGRLVEAVRALPDASLRLTPFGAGPLTAWIDAAAAADPRIDPARFVPRAAVVAAYAAADLLVQPRPVDQPVVRYSFPSKLLEYMASGTPVLTTRLAGIPPEYEPYVYWIDDGTAGGIARAIQTVRRIPAPEREARGLAAAAFVARTRSSGAQGARITRFLAELLRAG